MVTPENPLIEHVQFVQSILNYWFLLRKFAFIVFRYSISDRKNVFTG